MSEQRGNPKDSGQPAARKNRRRSRWFLTGGLVAGSLVAGAAGLTGVLALGGPDSTKNLGLPNLPDVFNSARPAGDAEGGQDQKNKHADNQGDERGNDEGSRNGGEWNGKGKGKDPRQGGQGHGSNHGDEEDKYAKEVRCNSDDLIAAIVKANAGDGATLKLAEKCTYTLTAYQYDSGLPTIVQPITIKGNDSKIVRAANAAKFRIFTVGGAGQLTLIKTTVEGGFDTTSYGGGGMLVQTGGRAKVIDSIFKRNNATNSGGAISNQGTTTLVKTAIANNSAGDSGGGVYTGPSSDLVVEDSWLTSNSTGDNGGGLANYNGYATVSKTEIIHNNANNGAGGGLFSGNGATSIIKHSSLSNNTSGTGGGLANNSSTTKLRDSKVSRNTATNGGGGVANNGTFVAEKSEINGNTTQGNGAGINSTGGSVVLHESKIEYNSANGSYSQAGGIYNLNSALSLTQTKVIENNANKKPGGIWTNITPTVDRKSVIIKNRPTNCVGSPAAVPNCFG
ncbi:right-handed parallel beta-helix repeat-containing protein [Micromonospora sp. NPDC003197]